MNVILNNKQVELTSQMSLRDFLDTHGIIKQGIAVAIDRKVVSRDHWDSVTVSNGMEIIVIKATCGG